MSKKLIILSKKDPKMKCSICNEPLYPVKIEIWDGDILNLSDFNNYFCGKCGLFEFEPEEDAEIYFNHLGHQEIYSEQL
ncbi:MAG: hypothetical protein KGD63_13090 [Candidatus Lokiarchaeota archaeon]|nr:hypothetical protein [Candidatus Lokiarchaeota archaeon]